MLNVIAVLCKIASHLDLVPTMECQLRGIWRSGAPHGLVD